MVDPLVVLEITGKQLLEALENGVSQYPKLEGRFPQVSGIQFTFDSTKPAGQRILSNTLLINGQSVISNKVNTTITSYCESASVTKNSNSEAIYGNTTSSIFSKLIF